MKDEVKAGITVVASLVLLSAFVILIGGSHIFEKFDQYYIDVTNAAGLETGAQVRLGGVRVGRVLDIRGPEGPGKPVTVAIGVKQGTPIYQGTKAVISQIGFVGDIYLLLAVDSTRSGTIRAGGHIPAQEAVDFGKMMAKLDLLSNSLDSLVKDADKLFSPKNVGEFGSILRNANRAITSGSSDVAKITASLSETSAKLQTVLTEVEDLVKTNKGEVNQLLKTAKQDLEKADSMIKSVESTAKSVEKTAGSIGSTIDLQSRNLDALLSAMTKTTEDLHDVLQEVGRKPWSVIYKEKREE